jgi:hypothetical protein
MSVLPIEQYRIPTIIITFTWSDPRGVAGYTEATLARGMYASCPFRILHSLQCDSLTELFNPLNPRTSFQNNRSERGERERDEMEAAECEQERQRRAANRHLLVSGKPDDGPATRVQL